MHLFFLHLSCWTEEQPGRPALFKRVASSSERRGDIWTACIDSVGKLINHLIAKHGVVCAQQLKETNNTNTNEKWGQAIVATMRFKDPSTAETFDLK